MHICIGRMNRKQSDLKLNRSTCVTYYQYEKKQGIVLQHKEILPFGDIF